MDWSTLYAMFKPEILPSCGGVFVAFVYLGARNYGVPWFGGKIGDSTDITNISSAIRLFGGLLLAFPTYCLAAFIISSWFYGATGEKQFFMSSLASMQVFVGRGILLK